VGARIERLSGDCTPLFRDAFVSLWHLTVRQHATEERTDDQESDTDGDGLGCRTVVYSHFIFDFVLALTCILLSITELF
jgi:hypothetical protein